MTVIYTGAIVVAFHAIYFAFFLIPAVIYLLLSRKNIIKIFKHVPKEVAGRIYQEINEHDDDDHKYMNILNPTTTIVIRYASLLITHFSCLVILVIEAAAVGLLWGLTIASIVRTNGSSEITKNAAFTSTAVSRIFNHVLEVVLHEERVYMDKRQSFEIEEHELRESYSSLLSGSHTVSGVGILNQYEKIDIYFREVC